MSRSEPRVLDLCDRPVRHDDRMRRRGRLNRKILGNRQRDRCRRTRHAVHHVDRHALCVRNDSLCTQVPRRDDGRKAPFPAEPGHPPQRLIDRQFNDDIRRCRDIAEVLSKQVRALLLHQARRASFQPRRVELFAGFVARLDAPLDHPVTGPDLIPADGAVCRQRKRIGQFQRSRIVVGKVLVERRSGDAAERLACELDALQRQHVAGC